MMDVQGKVLFDLENKVVEQDYFCWNDVWFMLCGQYGVCSMVKDVVDFNSILMYVVVLIISDGWIIGVLFVGKLNVVMVLVIKCSEWCILWVSVVLLGIVLVIGVGMVWWINCFIVWLMCYVDFVIENCLFVLFVLGSSELCKLVQVLESMCIKLEGKNEIEQYVYVLIYELKSLLVVICGVVEILCEGLFVDVVICFIENILV